MANHDFDSAYLDESGDSGAKGSKYLVLVLWCVEDNKKISKIIRNAKRDLLRSNKGARWLNRKGGEIKYSSFPDGSILKRVLDKLSKTESSLYYIVLNKNKKAIDLSYKEHILSEIFTHKSKTGKIPKKIIADLQFFHKKISYCILKEHNYEGENNSKRVFISKTLSEEDYRNLGKDEWDHVLKIEHRNSRYDEHLQALDVLSGAIFNYYENNDSSMLDILKEGKIGIKGVKVI